MHPHRRLTVLLQRFELREGASEAQLRAAYFRRAREIHPDVCGTRDGSGFVALTKDHEEAQRLMRQLGDRRVAGPFSNSSQVPHRAGPSMATAEWQYVWVNAASTGKTEERSAYSPRESPGPPPQKLLLFVGGSSALFLGWSLASRTGWLENSSPVDSSSQAAVAEVAVQDVATCVPQVASGVQARAMKKASAQQHSSGYYDKRVKKSEPSEMLKKRPHAKQRGFTYISPIHAAAEDGHAEWLHWVGEKSHVSLCQSLDRHRQTPLHYAARAGQSDACAVLLKFHADPRYEDAQGRTPLDLAMGTGDEDLTQMLRNGPPGPLASVMFRKPPTLHSQNKGIVG